MSYQYGLEPYQYVDRYIAEAKLEIGDWFDKARLAAWLNSRGYPIDAGRCLISHRHHPDQRIYGLERRYLGPGACYLIVETPTHVDGSALKRMHEQKAQEFVSGWQVERNTRMAPLALRSKRARRVLKQAEAEIAAVLTILNARLEEDE